MPRQDKTEIMLILDKSGSMNSLRDSIISAFNEFVDSQRKLPGQCTVSLILFDDTYNVQYLNKSIQDVTPLTTDEYIPSGTTALNDAIGKSIVDLGVKLSEIPEQERPAKVVVATFTDGQENSSTEYSLGKIKDMIKHQEDVYHWQFVLMGTDNLDLNTMSMDRGISSKRMAAFTNSAAGMHAMGAQLADAVAYFREFDADELCLDVPDMQNE